jgi:hypothetical protein
MPGCGYTFVRRKLNMQFDDINLMSIEEINRAANSPEDYNEDQLRTALGHAASYLLLGKISKLRMLELKFDIKPYLFSAYPNRNILMEDLKALSEEIAALKKE